MDWITCGLLFLSAVWTLILTAPIHCRGSIVDEGSKSDEETNSSTSWMSTFSANFHFGVNYSLKLFIYLADNPCKRINKSVQFVNIQVRFVNWIN